MSTRVLCYRLARRKALPMPLTAAQHRASPSLAEGVWRHARTRPEAPALSIEGRVWSYAELRDAAVDVARRLRARVAPGARPLRVGILASRSFETYAGILGAAWTGGAYVALNPKNPSARIASILQRAGLDAIVVDADGRRLLEDGAVRAALPRCVLADVAHASAPSGADVPLSELVATGPEPATPSQVAYIMFTSGTTGVPKGVVVTCGSVAHFLAAVRERYAIGPRDRVGQFAETSFDLSVFELFAAWDGGACLCVVPASQLLAPAGFLRRERITVWASVPSVIAMLLRMKMLEPGAFPALRASFLIGEALPVQSARAWKAAAPSSIVDNQYGPTEATCACTVQNVGEPVVETPGRGTVAIGRPYAGMEAEIVSGDAFLPDGETGELALAGPQLAVGYLDDTEQTARRFPILDHPRLGRGRWYLTGDLAFRDESGVLHWLGRTDHQVKILGHRIELEDLEAHLRVASGSDAVAAVAEQVAGAGATAIVAFVSGSAKSPAEIRERLRELVPPYMLPRRVVALDALPLSSNGKIDRHALRAIVGGPA